MMCFEGFKSVKDMKRFAREVRERFGLAAYLMIEVDVERPENEETGMIDFDKETQIEECAKVYGARCTAT